MTKHKKEYLEKLIDFSKERHSDAIPTQPGSVQTYIYNLLKLRRIYGFTLLFLLFLEITGMFSLIILTGKDMIEIDDITLILICQGIIFQVFFTIKMLVESIFPKEDFLLSIANLFYPSKISP